MSTAAADTAHELGEPLAEIRRGSRAVGIVMVTVAAALAAGCLWLARDAPGVLGLLVFPLLIGGIGWWGLRHAVRIHAGGIEVDGFIGRTRMRYDEADTLVYRSVAQNVNGIPVGTYVWAQLRGGKRKATFNMRTEAANAEALEDFRARASDAIVARGWERLCAGQPFAWGKAQQLDREALRFRASGLMGRKPEVAIPYAGLRYSFEAGSFSAYPPDSDDKLFSMQCDEPNFYPGLALFQHLTAAR